MVEPSFEALFGSCTLEVAIPDASVAFPEGTMADGWLASVRDPGVDRKQAFFDEQLRLFLIMSIDHPSQNRSHDSFGSAPHLADFLRHVQVSLEASYISQKSASSPETPQKSQITAPRIPAGPMKPSSLHPPTTPNPIPSTTEDDRKYVQSEGTLLLSAIWGHRPPEKSEEKFALLFSKLQGIWVAVYEFTLAVLFQRLPFPDPLLCLTTSATLREKALPLSEEAHPLVASLIKNGLISSRNAISDEIPTHFADALEEDDDIAVLEEVNLLEGLAIGSGLSSESEPLYLPSTRLGSLTRQKYFALPAISYSDPISTDIGSKRSPHVLRKSFRKVLNTASGFRVRMRTVFVPHILFQAIQPILRVGVDPDESDFKSENEEREAGNIERTVVLCVEVENSEESGRDVGFSLENVDVEIGGEGATTRLIGWGEGGCDLDIAERVFPLMLGPSEQYNLLYVVSFLNIVNDKDGFTLTAPPVKFSMELQRPVTISVQGCPYVVHPNCIKENEGSGIKSFPTRGFVSRWNCILDLSPRSREQHLQEQPSGPRTALPEAPSPFPRALSVFTPPSTAKLAPEAVVARRAMSNVKALRAANPSVSPSLYSSQREYPASPTPALVTSQALTRLQPVVSSMSPGARSSQFRVRPPLTPQPAALPTSSPNRVANDIPSTQPSNSQQGRFWSNAESQRDWDQNSTTRSSLPAGLGKSSTAKEALSTPTEPIIVSVGLLSTGDPRERTGQRKIYPSDVFTLDIFVYNQSSWIRRFEITHPDTASTLPQSRSQGKDVQKQGARLRELKDSIPSLGILPLQNRIRVGPLRPSACQSVRLDFLALSPGVHTVDILTITDIETGYSTNLQSVMDVVVYEVSEEHDIHHP